MLEVSLSGVGTVLRLECDAWSTLKCLRQATNALVVELDNLCGLENLDFAHGG